MAHLDRYHKGKKLVSATELQKIIGKPFLEFWKIKLCQCTAHAGKNKSPFKPAELLALERLGAGYCGHAHADIVKDLAGDLGTDVHVIVENWYKSGAKAEGDGEAVTIANKIIDQLILLEARPTIITPEDTVIDTDSNLAGSPDGVIDHNDPEHAGPAIVDYKIKGTLDELTGMQGAAYRYLLHRKFGKDVRWMLVLWYQKDTVGKVVKPVWIDLDEWREPWKCLVGLWNVLSPSRRVQIHE